MSKKLYIVHAVDAEGPMYESVKETIKRFNSLLKLPKKIKSTSDLKNALNGKLFSSKINKIISKNFNSHLLNYNKNLSDLNKMLSELKSKKFRNQLLDSAGNGYKITWHCVDHVNYKSNLRRKKIGYNQIFDIYSNYIKKNKLQDDVQFHFHPMSVYKESHRNSYLMMRNDNLFQILCRRIIDRNWFPSSFRAGFHTERQDLHNFLEEYIPFDLSNINKSKTKHLNHKPHLKAIGYDWRRATDKWEIYNPSRYDYQIKGKSKRYIGRVLSIMDRTVSIDRNEINAAFKRASKGNKTLLAVTNHDFRNIVPEINYFLNLIRDIHKKYKDVKIYYNTTTEGFKNCLNLNRGKKLKLKIKKIKDNSFKIQTLSGSVFGTQPFLAMKLKNGMYVHDNLNFDLKSKSTWYYTLNNDTVRPKDLSHIGIGGCDKYGNTSVNVIKV